MSEIRGNVAGGLDVNPSLKVVRESCGGDEPQNDGYSLSNRKKSGEQMNYSQVSRHKKVKNFKE